MRPIAFCTLWLFMACGLRSQSSAAQSTFEVASVKPSAADRPNMFIRVNPGGDLSIAGATLKILIPMPMACVRFKFPAVRRGWTPNQPSTAQLGTPTTPEALPQPAVPDGPSIFTALQEQLGLRLESEKGQVKVLVIDHAEKPSRN